MLDEFKKLALAVLLALLFCAAMASLISTLHAADTMPPAIMLGDHAQALALVPVSEATNVCFQSGDWESPLNWQGGAVPAAGAKVLVKAGVTVKSTSPIDVKSIRAEGRVELRPGASLAIDTFVVTPTGGFQAGTPSDPFTGTITFRDDGPITDWSRMGRALIVMGDLSTYGKETTSYVHAAVNPKAGATQIALASVPVNWEVGGQVVIPGVRPILPVLSSGPEGRDPVFAKQNELRTITAISGNVVTLDAPLAYGLHDQLSDGRTIPVGYLTRSIVFKSENKAVDRRGHIMVMAPTPHEFTFAYAELKDLGRTSQELHVTDPMKDAAGNVIAESLANVRGRYPLHFHKMGFASHATVKGVSIEDGLKWGVVNHSSNVDVYDSIGYNVHGAPFATEIGNEWGSYQRCLSIQSLGYGDLNKSATRTGREADKGREVATPFSPSGGDFGFNGSGFWLQSARVKLIGDESYGAVANAFDVQTIPVGTDHLGRQTAIYLSDLPAAERAKFSVDETGKTVTKLGVNNYPLWMQDCLAVGSAGGFNSWTNQAAALYGGSTLKDCVFQNTIVPLSAGTFGLLTFDGVQVVNHPGAMSGRRITPAADLYGRGDAAFKDVKIRGFTTAIFAGAIGSTTVQGSATLLDNVTNISVSPSTHDLVIELGDSNFGKPAGKNIVFDSADPTKPFRPKATWTRGGETFDLLPVGAPGAEAGVSLPGLVNAVAIRQGGPNNDELIRQLLAKIVEIQTQQQGWDAQIADLEALKAEGFQQIMDIEAQIAVLQGEPK